MRAAENRRWILLATNDGITAMIDPAGRVTARLPPYRQLAADMQYPVRAGDDVLYPPRGLVCMGLPAWLGLC